MEDIPADLIINWDQTAVKIVPSCSWTREKRGTKHIEVSGVDEKDKLPGYMHARCREIFSNSAYLPRYYRKVLSLRVSNFHLIGILVVAVTIGLMNRP
jgi:hypothetical protein